MHGAIARAASVAGFLGALAGNAPAQPKGALTISTAVFGLVEIDPSFSKRTVIVADRRNGQPLDGVEGPWRAFVPDDIRHARWIRGLVLIEVDTLKP